MPSAVLCQPADMVCTAPTNHHAMLPNHGDGQISEWPKTMMVGLTTRASSTADVGRTASQVSGPGIAGHRGRRSSRNPNSDLLGPVG